MASTSFILGVAAVLLAQSLSSAVLLQGKPELTHTRLRSDAELNQKMHPKKKLIQSLDDFMPALKSAYSDGQFDLLNQAIDKHTPAMASGFAPSMKSSFQ